MGKIPFHLGEIHSVGPQTRERMAGTLQAPGLQRLGLSLVGWSAARRGFFFVRQRPDMSQLLACVAGRGEVWLDGDWRPLQAGEAYATPPEAPHAYRATGPGTWQVCWAAYAAGPQAWRFPLAAPAVLRVEIEPLRLAIEGLCAGAAGPAADAAELALWTQLVHRRVLATLQPGGVPDSRLHRLWTRVNADLARPWTLAEMAREAALSREALRRHCLRECGHSPLREVARLRLQRAAELLRHTPDKVAAIAHRVGFTDPFAFSTAFKRAHGRSPQAWREPGARNRGIDPRRDGRHVWRAMSAPAASNEVSMETLVALCKRRGFIFPSSEIYGGFNGFFDYGPLGVELKKNIRDCWWRDMVQRRDDVVGIETSIIMHPKVWEASGHVAGFTDPLVDCKVSKQRYRADQLFFKPVWIDPKGLTEDEFRSNGLVPNFYVSALESENTEQALVEAAHAVKRKKSIVGFMQLGKTRDFTEAQPDEIALIPSPATGEPGSLTPPRAFNMMFETNVGALKDASSVAYLRPETAQGMFVDFKNVVDTGRVKLPFGIAQVGKSFRNEITPRNFIFRSREFEQMEMEYFIHEDADWAKAHKDWIQWCWDWLKSIGLPESHLSLYDHPKAKLAFYSRGTTDIMFKYPFGVQELWGIAARGSYDLTQHANASGKPQEIFDETTKKKFVPHVIEPAVGTDRIFLAALCAAYAEEQVTDEKGNTETRTVLRLSPRIAPVKVAVLPLLKNKEQLTARAQALYKKLQRRYAVFYDEAGAIGRRYRRQDEIGTPWCVTIDFETIEKPGDTFTLRERDSMQQKRITEAELFQLLDEQVY